MVLLCIIGGRLRLSVVFRVCIGKVVILFLKDFVWLIYWCSVLMFMVVLRVNCVGFDYVFDLFIVKF